jgi:hypothetical protein
LAPGCTVAHDVDVLLGAVGAGAGAGAGCESESGMSGGSQLPLLQLPPPSAMKGSGVEQLELLEVLLATATRRVVDRVTLPAASRAIARRAWVPLTAPAVFQLIAYGAVVSAAPRLTPLSVNCTEVTPTLSDAAADTVTMPLTVAPAAGEVTSTAGGVVSPLALPTVTETVADAATLPAASRASARSVWVPLATAAVFQAS